VSARIDSLFAEPKPSSAAVADASPSAVVSTCQPWSQADFASRVESFTPLRWFAKGDALSPLLCAAHGWRCTDADQVTCVTCGARVDASADSDASGVAARLVADAHSARCPWRDLACPTRFMHAPLHADGMRQLYREALPLLFELSRVPCVLPELLATLAPLLRKLPLYANLNCTDATRSDTVRCLALHGWTAPDRDSLVCELCRQRVSVASAVAIDDILAELPPARRAAPLFDPRNEHRVFCPWSRGDALSAMMRAFNYSGSGSSAKRDSASIDRTDSLSTLRAVRRALSSV
jgi:hypothetical protein